MSEDLTAAEPGKHRRVVLEAGVRIGTYTLTGAEVGSGGYAHVYEATHPTLELRVAIKVQDGYGDATIRERGLREAMVLSRVQHRNVVQIFDAEKLADGRQYLAMELLTGQTLREVLNDRPLSHTQCLAFLRGIASALDAIHGRGLVHRDLKPSNIFVCRDDDGEVYPKLIDFGIAKDLSLGNDRELTTSGSFIGTPAYMSPEQCLGKRTLDARSDIYALGVVAYQMLAGHPPFDGVLLEVAHAHAHTPVPSIRNANLPASLDPVFAQILAKDPEARPGSASDAIELIAEALAAPDAPVAPPRRRILAVAAGVAVIAIGAAVWITRGDDEPPRPTPSPAIAPSTPVDAVIAPVVIDATPEVVVAPDATPVIQKPKTRPKHPSIDDVESLPSN